MGTIRKYDGKKVIHKKHGEGALYGVDISLRLTKFGVKFKEGDDEVFRMFECSTMKFYKMLLTKKFEL